MFVYKNATPAYIIEIINAYRSILMLRGANDAMAKSKKHASVMMGEYDDPDTEESQNTYDPIASAGFFGICAAIETLVQSAYGKSKQDSRQISHAVPVAQQLMYSLVINDEEACAQIINWMRTGYIGSPSQKDIDRVEEFKKHLRVCLKFLKAFGEYAEAGSFRSSVVI